MRATDGVSPATPAPPSIGRSRHSPGSSWRTGHRYSGRRSGRSPRATSLYLTLTCLAVLVGLLGIVNAIVAVRRGAGYESWGCCARWAWTGDSSARWFVPRRSSSAVVGAVLGIGLGTFFGWAAGRGARGVIGADTLHRAGGGPGRLRRRGDGGRRRRARRCAASTVGGQRRRSATRSRPSSGRRIRTQCACRSRWLVSLGLPRLAALLGRLLLWGVEHTSSPSAGRWRRPCW